MMTHCQDLFARAGVSGRVILCVFAFAALVPNSAPADRSGQASKDVRFKLHRIDTYRTEACGVGDFNNDGKLDIISGQYIYLAPDFRRVQVRKIEGDIDDQGKGYNRDFMNAPLDVDGDGLLDVVSCSWHGKRIEWYRNTGKWPTARSKTNTAVGQPWPMTVVFENGNYECGELWDVDGDGKANDIVPAVQGTVWYEVGVTAKGKKGLVRHVVSTQTHLWGNGVGDINGDGHPDLLRPSAWYEGPADPRKGTWKQHPLAIGGLEEGKADHTPQILVYDVNNDGLNDIITSIAHNYGIFWYQQIKGLGEPTWKRHLIDKSWSQAHSLALADLDQDGDLDLVTGKRFMAHNGHDPGGNEPLGVYWYELDRSRAPTWTRHVLSHDQGIGSGLNLCTVDLDGDGDIDIVVTGKWGGPAWFENLGTK